MNNTLVAEIYEEIHLKSEQSYSRTNEEMKALIDEIVRIKGQSHDVSIDQLVSISNRIYSDIRGLSVLQPLIDDPEVTEIMVNGYKQIYKEVSGRLISTDIEFESQEKLEDLIQKIVGQVNRLVNEAVPICDARLLDGSRVNVVLPPIAVNGPTLTIRKFANSMMTMEDLIETKSVSEEVAKYLHHLVEAKYNIFICGGTGSGKTTLLNILSNYVEKDERIITIEDSAELQLHQVEHWVRLEARNGNNEGCKPITIRDLIKTGLRMRPDRLIVGEVRGEEAIDMLQAMNTGHDGSLSTGHANGIKDMLSRLETMVLMNEDIPLKAVRGQIASAIDVFVQVGRMSDYSRKVLEIAKVTDVIEGEIQLETLFYYDSQSGEHKKADNFVQVEKKQ